MCWTDETKCQCRFLNPIELHLRTKVINKDIERVTTNRPPQKNFYLEIGKIIPEGKSEMQGGVSFCLTGHFCVYHLHFTLTKTPDLGGKSTYLYKKENTSTAEPTRVRQGLSPTTLKVCLLWRTLGETLSIEKSRRCRDGDREKTTDKSWE